MSEFTTLITTMTKEGVIGAIVFAIWWLYHKAVTEQFKEILAQMKEREIRHYELLKDSIETNKLIISTLQKINSSIDNNNWCPIAKEFHEGGLNVKPANNAG